MTDLPSRVQIHEEGPREGFQIEPGPIATADKVRFCEALAETGLRDVQCVSFVDPRRVPGMADAVDVAQSIRQRPDVAYTAIALNLRGYERAIQTPLHIAGDLQMSASNTFSIRNTNKDNAETLAEQRRQLEFFRDRRIPVESAIVMTAFGCNFEGAIAPETVRDCVASLLALADDFGIILDRVRLADTVGWASPASIERVVGAVRDRYPSLRLALHLHDNLALVIPSSSWPGGPRRMAASRNRFASAHPWLTHRHGTDKLYEMALTGEPIDAAEALHIGLLNYVVPAAELDAKLDWLLSRLLDKSPTAIRRGKYAMRVTEQLNFDQSAVFMEAQIGTLALTEDAAEGRAAFIEKRARSAPSRGLPPQHQGTRPRQWACPSGYDRWPGHRPKGLACGAGSSARRRLYPRSRSVAAWGAAMSLASRTYAARGRQSPPVTSGTWQDRRTITCRHTWQLINRWPDVRGADGGLVYRRHPFRPRRRSVALSPAIRLSRRNERANDRALELHRSAGR